MNNAGQVLSLADCATIGGMAPTNRQLGRHPERATPRARRGAWNWLLLLPVVALCFPGVYARSEPALLGWPFFYWYQFAWIVLSGIITAVVYLATED